MTSQHMKDIPILYFLAQKSAPQAKRKKKRICKRNISKSPVPKPFLPGWFPETKSHRQYELHKQTKEAEANEIP